MGYFWIDVDELFKYNQKILKRIHSADYEAIYIRTFLDK